MPSRNNKNKTLKRKNGSRNLTRNANRAANQFIYNKTGNGMNGTQIRNAARGMNKNMRNRVDKMLVNMGM
jgi:hypothetical protein